MIKFIVLVFALFAVSNKKLKIQYQKHQYFYSFQKRNQEKKNPEPSVIFVAIFRFSVTKDCSFSLNSGQLT